MPNIIRPIDPVLQQFPRRDRDHRESLGERLLENRILFLSGIINEYVASEAIMALLYLQSIKKDQDVNLYINSPGGVVDQTLAIYDTIQFMGCDVATYCIGQAASGAALLLMAARRASATSCPTPRSCSISPAAASPARRGHSHPGRGDPEGQEAAQRDYRQAHRPVGGENRRGDGARPLHDAQEPPIRRGG